MPQEGFMRNNDVYLLNKTGLHLFVDGGFWFANLRIVVLSR